MAASAAGMVDGASVVSTPLGLVSGFSVEDSSGCDITVDLSIAPVSAEGWLSSVTTALPVLTAGAASVVVVFVSALSGAIVFVEVDRTPVKISVATIIAINNEPNIMPIISGFLLLTCFSFDFANCLAMALSFTASLLLDSCSFLTFSAANLSES